jgi:DNA-directed RNA polymerase omega subunit
VEKYNAALDSKFRLINVAAKRCRELRSGARPRVHVDSKNFARIALEEVKMGQVKFEVLVLPPKDETILPTDLS